MSQTLSDNAQLIKTFCKFINMSKIHLNPVSDNIFPFKNQFQKKFMGKQAQQLLVLKRRLLKDPVDEKLKLIFGDNPSLQAKICELQKINSTSRKGANLPKKGQYMTPLQVYNSKKQLKKYQESKLFMTMPCRAKMSDQQINDRFSQFLVAKKYGQNSHNLRNTLLVSNSLSQRNKIEQIRKRQDEMKMIAQKMIRQNKSPFDNPEDFYSDDESVIEKTQKIVNKNINWILKQCNKYEKKYIIRHKKAKSTKKL